MKCPVCGEEYTYEVDWCFICGFNKFRTEFLNEEERKLWLAETVEPCKAVYEAACESYDSLDERYDELQDDFNELQEKYDELLEKYEQMLKSGIHSSNASPTKKVGWNYDDLIAHPNYAKCSYVNDSSVVEIYNIQGEGTSEYYTIKFYVKMLSRKYGCNRIHFNWRLKDPDGVVARTGGWIKDGLLPGDVIRGEIGFYNIGAHYYTIDFIDV